MAEKYGSEKCIVLEYHTNDELATSQTESRAQWYNARGLPTAKFNGTKTQVGGSETIQTEYEKIVNELMQTTASFSITLSGNISSEHAMMKATVTPLTTATRSNLKFRWAMYEDNVELKGKRYRFVVREIVTEDSLPLQGKKPVDIKRTFKVNPAWKYTNLGIVAFIQDDSSKEILQAAVFKAGK
ncbi:MAG: Omp28-related outer membrane protein [bacterium]|nr:Omp28-related outer membrane protein [bacterium]